MPLLEGETTLVIAPLSTSSQAGSREEGKTDWRLQQRTLGQVD